MLLSLVQSSIAKRKTTLYTLGTQQQQQHSMLDPLDFGWIIRDPRPRKTPFFSRLHKNIFIFVVNTVYKIVLVSRCFQNAIGLDHISRYHLFELNLG